MTRRDDVAKLLRTRATETSIAQQTGVSRFTVARIRRDLGLPRPTMGGPTKYASIEAMYFAKTVFGDDGHACWTGTVTRNETPMLKRCGVMQSAYRVAFRIHHGRDPEGTVRPVCGRDHCVAGDHIADTPMRRAIRKTTRSEGPAPWDPRMNGTREEITELLGQGLSNKRIGQILHTNPKRVGAIRRELGLPAYFRVGPSLEEKWAARARPTARGHVRWTGALRDGTPNIVHDQRNHSARRVGFKVAHGREPEGRVLPGCGMPWCVAGEHATDATIRRADHLYADIFGAAA